MELFDTTHSIVGNFIDDNPYIWETIKNLKNIIPTLISRLKTLDYNEIYPTVFAHKTAMISPSAQINGFTIIGKNAQIRHSAYIRGNAVIGDDVVIGNSCEVKNAVIFDGAQIPHFNYVGDSIIGYKAHLGAGVILSNLKSDKSAVVVNVDGKKYNTGMQKLGAIVGDYAEIGCNTVLNPGTIVGKNAIIYPLSCVRGTVLGNTIYKSNSERVMRL